MFHCRKSIRVQGAYAAAQIGPSSKEWKPACVTALVGEPALVSCEPTPLSCTWMVVKCFRASKFVRTMALLMATERVGR